MIAVIELKKCIAGTCILGIIAYEFHRGQEFYLMNLFLIDKNTKISLYCAILSLCLVIYLSIKYNEKLLLNVKKIA